MAGGFSIKRENIDTFRDFITKEYDNLNISSSENLKLYLDTIIAPSALNEEFYSKINSLAPFGSGNNEPKFVIENLKVIKSYVVANNHIKSILVGKDGSVVKSFAWNAMNTPLETILNNQNS